MNKAEFLKKWKPWINPFKYSTGDFESDLQQYADEQSREEAIAFAKWHNEAGFIIGRINEKLYNEWKSNQEGE